MDVIKHSFEYNTNSTISVNIINLLTLGNNQTATETTIFDGAVITAVITEPDSHWLWQLPQTVQ